MARRRARDPEAARARERAWRLANPEKFKATQHRFRDTPCLICGAIRQLHNAREKSQYAICRNCNSHVQPVSVLCYWCRGGFKMPRYLALRSRYHWHSTCRGSMTRAAVLLGITRERVRQLVKKRYMLASRNGCGITRKEALEAVLAERGVPHA